MNWETGGGLHRIAPVRGGCSESHAFERVSVVTPRSTAAFVDRAKTSARFLIDPQLLLSLLLLLLIIVIIIHIIDIIIIIVVIIIVIMVISSTCTNAIMDLSRPLVEALGDGAPKTRPRSILQGDAEVYTQFSK